MFAQYQPPTITTERCYPKAAPAPPDLWVNPAKSRPVGIYLAARYDHLSLMQQYKHRLEQAGFAVTSRWVTGDHEAYERETTPSTDPLRMLFAMEDFQDIRAADWVVSFTEKPGSGSSRGGRHVELGVALALGKRCIVIGPRENVFHYLPQIVHYPTWEDFITNPSPPTV